MNQPKLKTLYCSKCLNKVENKIENVHDRKEFILGHWCDNCDSYQGIRLK